MNKTTSVLKICRDSGVTVVEVLVVVSILMILVALTYPALVTIRDRGQQARCVSNFRQIYTALTLYRQEWNGSDAPAPSSEMGFPGLAYTAILGKQAERNGIVDWWNCHGKGPWSSMHATYWQMWAPIHNERGAGTEYDAFWIAHVQKMGDASIVFLDPNHQLSYPANGFSMQRAIGMHLGGSIAFRVKRGMFYQYKFWED
ncbi:MAG: prepilin-type N-terminal cleavage/methylation domain-containing protein [Armatimonadetes bacterium]|nr:prepilin-type N-terminal cleavage/methylation domain-containing protein [Armatimonadota bacterium]